MPTAELKKFLEEIDFLPMGEKLKQLSNAIAEKRRGGNGENVAILRKKMKEERQKLWEMQEIFREFNAKITEGQISSISYPDGLKRKDAKSFLPSFRGGFARKIGYYTSGRMEGWFAKNILARGLKPFRKRFDERIEGKIIRLRALGAAEYIEKESVLAIVLIQPLAFFGETEEGDRQGLGVSQPLRNAHLLMLFDLLRHAKKKKYKFAIFEAKYAKEHSEKRVYEGIANIATEYLPSYGQAFFKRK